MSHQAQDIKKIATALYEATKDLQGAELGKTLQGFVALLAKKNLLSQAEKIIAAFIAYAQQQECVREIDITTARAVEIKLLEAIQSAFGKNVNAHMAVDESLIGGFVVKTKDTIFDASLKTQINKLKQSLT